MIGQKEGRWGSIKYFLKDEYVGKSIHNYGEYNPDETEFILSLADKDKLCLDIGANIGVIGQALLHEGHKVISFEPQPEVFKLLEFNCAKANKLYNVAVGDEIGTAKMPKIYYSEKNNVGGLGIGSYSRLGYYDVPIITIDSLDLHEPIGLIKIDVEGYEIQTIKGMLKTIEKNKPILYVEDDRTNNSVELRKLIKSLGYSITEHRPLLFREDNYFNNSKNIWEPYQYASHNIICRPTYDRL